MAMNGYSTKHKKRPKTRVDWYAQWQSREAEPIVRLLRHNQLQRRQKKCVMHMIAYCWYWLQECRAVNRLKYMPLSHFDELAPGNLFFIARYFSRECWGRSRCASLLAWHCAEICLSKHKSYYRKTYTRKGILIPSVEREMLESILACIEWEERRKASSTTSIVTIMAKVVRFQHIRF